MRLEPNASDKYSDMSAKKAGEKVSMEWIGEMENVCLIVTACVPPPTQRWLD